MTNSVSLGRIPKNYLKSQTDRGAVKNRSGIRHLNCFDKSLLAFEVNCTGRRIGYSGILSVQGEPDPDRLRKAILSTARAHPN